MGVNSKGTEEGCLLLVLFCFVFFALLLFFVFLFFNLEPQ